MSLPGRNSGSAVRASSRSPNRSNSESSKRITPIGALRPGGDAVVEGVVASCDVLNGRRRSLLVLMLMTAVLSMSVSNTATAAAFFPIMGSVAVGVGIDPLVMTIVLTLAVCSAYMLPVATPSYAVAFGSGEVSIRQMVRAGVWLNLISLLVITALLYTLIPALFAR